MLAGWIGEIAEIAIYNRNLEDDEVKAAVNYFIDKFELNRNP